MAGLPLTVQGVVGFLPGGEPDPSAPMPCRQYAGRIGRSPLRQPVKLEQGDDQDRKQARNR